MHFLTTSFVGDGNVRDLRQANMLLRTRNLYGNHMNDISCSWVVIPDTKENNHMWENIRQITHIANEVNCKLLIAEYIEIENVDHMAFVAVKEVMSRQPSVDFDYILFMLPHCIIISDPMPYIYSLLAKNTNVKGIIGVNKDKEDIFGLSFILLPTSPLRYMINNGHLLSNSKNDHSLSNMLQYMITELRVEVADIPLQLRYPLINDVSFRMLHNISESDNSQLDVVILIGTSGTGIEFRLFPTSDEIFTNTPSGIYQFNNKYYECGSIFMRTSIESSSNGNSGFQKFMDYAKNRNNISENSLNHHDYLCRKILGNILPNSAAFIAQEKNRIFSMKSKYSDMFYS